MTEKTTENSKRFSVTHQMINLLYASYINA